MITLSKLTYLLKIRSHWLHCVVVLVVNATQRNASDVNASVRWYSAAGHRTVRNATHRARRPMWTKLYAAVSSTHECVTCLDVSCRVGVGGSCWSGSDGRVRGWRTGRRTTRCRGLGASWPSSATTAAHTSRPRSTRRPSSRRPSTPCRLDCDSATDPPTCPPRARWSRSVVRLQATLAPCTELSFVLPGSHFIREAAAWKLLCAFSATKTLLWTTRSHPEMVGDMSRVTLNFDLSKNSFCAFLARVKTYTHTKN